MTVNRMEFGVSFQSRLNSMQNNYIVNVKIYSCSDDCCANFSGETNFISHFAMRIISTEFILWKTFSFFFYIFIFTAKDNGDKAQQPMTKFFIFIFFSLLFSYLWWNRWSDNIFCLATPMSELNVSRQRTVPVWHFVLPFICSPLLLRLTLVLLVTVELLVHANAM